MAPRSPTDHHDRDPPSVAIAVVTVSDTRTLENDHSGEAAVNLLVTAGHRVVERLIVTDDEAALFTCLRTLIDRPDVEAIVTTGGTGIAPRDHTPEVVASLLEVELPGFGEMFRSISAEEIGAKAILSRAIAGCAGGCLLFALPGSTAAVRTGITRCVLPVLPHAAGLLRGDRSP